jgi:PRTRC genetic system protein E
MTTNFFQQLAGLGFKGNFLLNINQDETGVQTVSVVLKKDKAIDGLPPMLFKATADELDEGFFEQLAQPVRQTAGLISNMESYQKELEKAKKNAKPDKAKAGKPADTDPEDDEQDEEKRCLPRPRTTSRLKPKRNGCMTKRWNG